MKTQIAVTIDRSVVEAFLEYLVLGIRASVGLSSSSEADELPDGRYVETIRCGLKVGADPIPAVWTLVMNPDGSMGPIEISVDDEAPKGWQEAAEAVVSEARSSALKRELTRIFTRRYFAYFGPPLDGEYYIGDFRIAPSPPLSGWPYGNGEEVLSIDQYSEGMGGNAADAFGRLLAQDRASLLSVFLDIGLHEIPTKLRWVYATTEPLRCEQLQLGHRARLRGSISSKSRMTGNGAARAGRPYRVAGVRE